MANKHADLGMVKVKYLNKKHFPTTVVKSLSKQNGQ